VAELSVDTVKIGAALPHVETLSHQVAALHDQLTGELQALGTCWGGDATGKAFAAQYLPSVEKELGGLTDAVAGLRNMHDGVQTMVDGFAATEAASSQTARGLMVPRGSSGAP